MQEHYFGIAILDHDTYFWNGGIYAGEGFSGIFFGMSFVDVMLYIG